MLYNSEAHLIPSLAFTNSHPTSIHIGGRSRPARSSQRIANRLKCRRPNRPNWVLRGYPIYDRGKIKIIKMFNSRQKDDSALNVRMLTISTTLGYVSLSFRNASMESAVFGTNSLRLFLKNFQRNFAPKVMDSKYKTIYPLEYWSQLVVLFR